MMVEDDFVFWGFTQGIIDNDKIVEFIGAAVDAGILDCKKIFLNDSKHFDKALTKLWPYQIAQAIGHGRYSTGDSYYWVTDDGALISKTKQALIEDLINFNFGKLRKFYFANKTAFDKLLN